MGNIQTKFNVNEIVSISLGTIVCFALLLFVTISLYYCYTNKIIVFNNNNYVFKPEWCNKKVYIKNRGGGGYMIIDKDGKVTISGNDKEYWTIEKWGNSEEKYKIKSEKNGQQLYFLDKGFKSNTLWGNEQTNGIRDYNIFKFEMLENDYFAIRILRNSNCTSNKCLNYDNDNFYMDYDINKNKITPNGDIDIITSQWIIESL